MDIILVGLVVVMQVVTYVVVGVQSAHGFVIIVLFVKMIVWGGGECGLVGWGL